MSFFDSTVFTFVILPAIIFIARVFDVSIGTLRLIYLSKGNKFLVPVLGFFEVLIWILAITKIMENADNWICYIAYAGGFAAGNYVGILIEEKLAVGVVILRIITHQLAEDLTEALRDAGYGITIVEAKGLKGDVSILFTTIPRSKVSEIVAFITKHNPSAFYSVEDVRLVNQGIFPGKKKSARMRKGK